MSNENTTLRDRAIAIRLRWIDEERNRRHRSNELWTASDSREHSRERIAIMQREVTTLRAMPADVDDHSVRVAMGVA